MIFRVLTFLVFLLYASEGYAGERRVVFVDKNGTGTYTTIAAAVAGTNNGDTIIVNAGTYEEEVHMWGKTRHIVGVDRDSCILTNGTGNYLTPPLEANIGSISNMTIIADNYDPTIQDPSVYQERASYGIHIEYANSTAYTLSIRNCKIVSKWSAALGIGLRYNQTVEIIDCELISNSERVYSSYAGHWVEMGGLFFHNDGVSNNAGTGKLFVRNSRLQGKKAALVMEAVNKPGLVDAEFSCNTLVSEDYGVGSGIIYRFDNMVTQPGYLCGNKITLAIGSHSNNIDELNFSDESAGISITPPATSEGSWYDLNGQKLDGTSIKKGIYINNGRKIVVK
ncbi:MAG: hypothetical protein IKT00_05335 [Prevotella sp.]|nr:hypothetical protein [Prevotella sp.]